MASTPNHAVQGALLTGIALRFFGLLLAEFLPVFFFFIHPLIAILSTILMTLGAVAGAAPDIIGWIGRLIYDGDDLYGEAHSGILASKLKWVPMYGLHLLVDRPFHTAYNKGHWWPDLWLLEAIFWVINAVVASCLILL